MLPTAIIAFREFFEAFLIIGVFLGLSKQLQLKKETEILSASGLGILLSIALALATFLIGSDARTYLSKTGAELLSGYAMLASGIFIAYVVYSLHKAMSKAHQAAVKRTREKLSQEVFDAALFFTIVALILREGFEVALFTASVSLFADFVSNVYGLLFGFAGAAVIGTLVYLAYTKLPIKKIFTTTEYAIVVLGAVMFAGGFVKVMEGQFGIMVSGWLKIPLGEGFGTVAVFVAAAYVYLVWKFLMQKSRQPFSDAS